MTKVLINFDFPAATVLRLRENYPDLAFAFCNNKDEMLASIPDAEVLITFSCSKEVLEHAKALRWIQVLGAGVDALPLDYIKEQGLILTNGKGIHQSQMSEYAIWAMMSLARNTHLLYRNQMAKTWNNRVKQDELAGSTVGILGLGSIGMEIARKASTLGMHVIGVKKNPEKVPGVDAVYGNDKLDLLFSQSDYVINLLPHTPKTTKLIDKRLFNMMKNDACFINVGRGATVNEADMVHALQTGQIRAAVSDVFEEEPLPATSPLWDLENVIITPHICGISPQYAERAMAIIEHNLDAYVGRGTMINVVDLEEGY